MTDRPKRPGADGGTILGVLLILAGAGLLWVGVSLDVSIGAPAGQIANLDLLNIRTNIAIAGAAAFVGGCVLAR